MSSMEKGKTERYIRMGSHLGRGGSHKFHQGGDTDLEIREVKYECEVGMTDNHSR